MTETCSSGQSLNTPPRDRTFHPDRSSHAGPEAGARGTGAPLDIAAILRGVREGQRNDKLSRYACSLRFRGLRQEEAERLIRLAWSAADPGSMPFPIEEALGILERVYQRYEDGPRQGWRA